MNCGISPVALLGSPLWQASLVSATVTPQLPNRKPICWLPASYWTTETEEGGVRLRDNNNRTVHLLVIIVSNVYGGREGAWLERWS